MTIYVTTKVLLTTTTPTTTTTFVLSSPTEVGSLLNRKEKIGRAFKFVGKVEFNLVSFLCCFWVTFFSDIWESVVLGWCKRRENGLSLEFWTSCGISGLPARK